MAKTKMKITASKVQQNNPIAGVIAVNARRDNALFSDFVKASALKASAVCVITAVI